MWLETAVDAVDYCLEGGGDINNVADQFGNTVYRRGCS